LSASATTCRSSPTPDFWRSTWLATVYAVGSTALQILAGVAGALILHQRFAGCDFLRGVALFPYMIPTVIAVFVWRWLMNDLYGVIPYMLSALPIPGLPEAWLSHRTIMWVLIILSVWTFFPFVLVNVLARLQTIPPELYDAARVDGASVLRQFFHVTLPQLRKVLLIVCSSAASGCSPSSTSPGCSASAGARARRSGRSRSSRTSGRSRTTRPGWARRSRT
jgi:multiple sugar transport system permease protein